MYTIKKFNDEVMAFTQKYGVPPTTAHLSQRQQTWIYHENCVARGIEPNRFATPRVSQLNGIKIRNCGPTFDGPHFSVVD
jgi:hypothetical protein